MNAQQRAEVLLRNRGPMLSSQLASLFQQADKGLSPEAARQRVSRLVKPIRKLSGISFGRAKFLYLNEQYGSDEFKSKLAAALIEEKTSAGRALSAIRRIGGVCPEGLLPVIAGTPTVNRKGHISTELVIKFLKDNRLLNQNSSTGLYLLSNSEENASLKFLQEIRSFTLDMFAKWVIRANLSSTNAVDLTTTRSTAEFGGFGWDWAYPLYWTT